MLSRFRRKKETGFLLCLLLLASSSAVAAPFYQETFSFDSYVFPYNAQPDAAWKAFKTGSRVGIFANLKMSVGLVRNDACYNSFPTGPADGYALWAGIIDGVTIFTDEYPFPIDSLALASYLQRLSGFVTDPVTLVSTFDGTRLALRIRSADGSENWYISDDKIRQQKMGIWEQVVWSPQTMTYGIVPAGTLGPAAPGAGNSGNRLPGNGVVTAFGVFVDSMTGRVRVDNFRLDDNLASNGILPQPTPTRNPNVTPGVLPTPDEVEPTATPTLAPGETRIPGTEVTPTPTIGVVTTGTPQIFSFCTASKKVSAKVKLSKASQRKVLRRMTGKTVKARRDRIVVEMVINRGVRASSLENVRVSDFYKRGTKYYLNVYGTDGRPVRLTAALAKELTAYIKSAGLETQTQSPLFRVIGKSGAMSTSAACRTELSRVVSQALKKAKVRK